MWAVKIFVQKREKVRRREKRLGNTAVELMSIYVISSNFCNLRQLHQYNQAILNTRNVLIFVSLTEKQHHILKPQMIYV